MKQRAPNDAEFEKGLKRRREVLGDAWVDRALQNTTGFTEEFQSLLTRYAWNEIWTRPGLDEQTRRLLVLAFTIALGRWEEFELHFRAAVEHGVPIAALKEVLLQSAVYCGLPAANTAFRRAQAILSS
jgi:3-oxoadipate enol-lactonase